MSKYGWTLWGSIQDGISELDFDFWGWAMEKYERAVAEFDGPDFERLLDGRPPGGLAEQRDPRDHGKHAPRERPRVTRSFSTTAASAAAMTTLVSRTAATLRRRGPLKRGEHEAYATNVAMPATTGGRPERRAHRRRPRTRATMPAYDERRNEASTARGTGSCAA